MSWENDVRAAAMPERQSDIINLISDQIAALTKAVDAERTYPQRDADAMDDFIADGRTKVKALRLIREDLERIFYGAIE